MSQKSQDQNTAGIITRRSFVAGAAVGIVAIAGGLLGAYALSNPAGASAAEQASSSQTDGVKAVSSAADAKAGSSAASSADNSAASDGATGGSGRKILVAYFSGMGHTEKAANIVADTLGADVFVIEPANPYTEDDQNFNDDSSRVSIEHNDPSTIDNTLAQYAPDNWADYDTIILGYPIWWMDASWAMQGFASGNDFTGKTIIPFCTSYSSPVGRSVQTLADLAGTGDWQDGTRFQQDFEDDEVKNWVASLGL